MMRMSEPRFSRLKDEQDFKKKSCKSPNQLNPDSDNLKK